MFYELSLKCSNCFNSLISWLDKFSVPATKTIKRLYYYSVAVFYVKKTLYRYLPGTSVKPPAIIKPAQNSIIIDLE